MEINATPNIYSSLKQAPHSLSRHLRDKQFANLVEERTRNFVGRQFIFNAIDKIIENSDNPSGYILIKGEPGIGKTALIAKLVKEHDWIHHFNIRAQGITSTSAFLNNICAQLITLYHLNYPELPPEADRDSGFLSTLLFEAASRRPPHPIVILVDALDEAEEYPAFAQNQANKLLLPASLPDKVFFIITTREQNNYRLVVDREESIYLSDDSPQNLADVKLYIENYLQENQEQMNSAVAAWRVSREDFVKIITEKSQGNFMYLFHVLRDIRAKKLTAANVEQLQDLPSGLKNYYQQHWERMKRTDERLFEDIYKPVLCTLAAAREPISLIRISAITHLVLPDVKRVLEEWREFLNEGLSEQNKPLYRLYHASFRDFLDEEVNLTSYNRLIAEQIESKFRWKS